MRKQFPFFLMLALLASLLRLTTLPAAAEPTNALLSAAGDERWWNGFGTVGLKNGDAVDFPSALAKAPNGFLYAATNSVSRGSHILYQDNGQWAELPIASVYPNNISALMVNSQGDLFAAIQSYGFEGYVYSVIQWDGLAWHALGGTFSGAINRLAFDSNGDLYAAGDFTTVEEKSINYIARWDGTAWQPLGSGMNGAILALAPDSAGGLYVGGSFTRAGGDTHYNIAYWDGAHWQPLNEGTSGTVRALQFDAAIGALYVGGDFTFAGTKAVYQIARWDGSNWYNLASGQPDMSVVALAQNPSTHELYVASFGDNGAYIRAWNGSAWRNLAPWFESYWVIPISLLYVNQTLFMGGPFNEINLVTVNGIVQWDGSRWSTFGAAANYPVSVFTRDSGGALIAGGEFYNLGGIFARGVARYADGAWQPMSQGIEGDVNALAVDSSGAVIAGGLFPTAGGTTVNNIARWNGSAWQALGSGVSSGTVFAVAADSSGNVYAGGSFTSANGSPASRVAMWNGSTWQVLGSGLNNQVRALVVDPASQHLVAGGWFTQAGGQPASRLAIWDGSAWQALPKQVNGDVLALAISPSGELVAGGDFTSAGGVTVNRIARWDGANWQPYGGGANAAVRSLAFSTDGRLWIGGDFTSVGGTAANRVAMYNGSAWESLGSGVNDTVRAVTVLPNGDVFTGGLFTQAGLKWSYYIGRYFQPYPVSGTVRDAGGNPVAGITISAGPDFQATTAADGTYTLNLPSQHFTLHPSRPGCILCRFTPAAREVNLSGASISGQDFVIDPLLYSLGGTILDNFGNPVVGTTLTAGTYTTRTGSDGGFRLRNLPAGTYTLTPAKPDTTFFPAYLETTTTSPDRTNLNFQAIKPGYQRSPANFMSTPQVVTSVIKLPGNHLLASGFYLFSPSSIGEWNGSQWQPFAAGLDSQIRTMARCGTTLYGAGEVSVARWDGSAWQPLGSGVTGTQGSNISSLACDSQGNLYIGGDFSSVGGVTSPGVAKWNGQAWQAMGAGIGYSRKLVVTANDQVYAANGNGVYLWNGASWGQLGNLREVYTTFDADASGVVYARGYQVINNYQFATRLARWDGARWREVDAFTGYNLLALDPTGGLAVSGMKDLLLHWDGYQWLPVTNQIDYSGNTSDHGMQIDTDGNILAYGLAPNGEGIVIFKKLHTVSGTVRLANGQPLAGVSVTMGPSSTINGADGSYWFAPQNGDCSTQADPFTAVCDIIPHLAGYVFEQEHRLASITNADVTGQDFTAYPSRLVSGKVTDEMGQGVAGVEISAGSHHAVTQGDGTYQLYLRTEAYTLVPSLETCPACRFSPASRQINSSSADVPGQDFTIHYRYAIRGTVTAPLLGWPVAGVTIDAGNGISAVTGADGQFALLDLPPASYTLTPSYPACADCVITPATQVVTLTDRDVNGQDFSMQIQLRIAGTVRDTLGQPVSGVTIFIPGQNVSSGADGTYAFTALQPGHYTLTPTLDSCQSCFLTPSSRTLDLQLADMNGQDFTAQIQLNITGMVRDTLGQPVSGVTISRQGQNVSSGADGTYAFTALPRGHYTLTPAMDSCSGCIFAPSSRTLDLQLTDVSGQDFTVQILLSITGTVRDTLGQPVSGVTISIPGQNVSSGADGKYTLTGIFPGHYTLTPTLNTCPGCPFIPSSRTLDLQRVDKSGQDFTVQLPSNLWGMVRSSDPIFPLEGAIVTASYSGGSFQAVTDSQGGYGFSNLPAGTYTLTVSQPDCRDCSSTPLSAQRTLPSLADPVDFSILLRSRIYGVIRDQGNSIEQGIPVFLYRNGLQVGQILSLADGSYEFSNLPHDNYTVQPQLPNCAACGSTPANQFFSGIKKDKNANFTINLAMLLDGQVVDNSSRPVPGAAITIADPHGNSQTITTDALGAYAASVLSPGDYLVTPSMPGCAVCAFDVPNRLVHLTFEDVSIPKFYLTANLSISGYIRTEVGAPQSGITMILSNGKGWKTTTISGADGSYRVGAPAPGSYFLDFEVPRLVGGKVAPRISIELPDGYTDLTNQNFSGTFLTHQSFIVMVSR